MASTADTVVIYPVIDTQLSVFLCEQSAVATNGALCESFDPAWTGFSVKGCALSVSLHGLRTNSIRGSGPATEPSRLTHPTVVRALPPAATQGGRVISVPSSGLHFVIKWYLAALLVSSCRLLVENLLLCCGRTNFSWKLHSSWHSVIHRKNCG